ncbi:MAG: FecR family protein [Sphingobacteriaceae bacterium]
MSEEKYWNLMSRYLANELSLEETEELLTWLDDDPARADLLKELQDTWDATKNYPENFNVDTSAGWQKLRTLIDQQERPKVRTLSKVAWIGIAASFLLVAFVGFLGYKNLTQTKLVEITTIEGQNTEIMLPDGSKVWLNENSTLSYPDDFNEDAKREVKLKGEAFFEVTKNPERPFIIEAGKTVTRVLGTSFNVRQDNQGSIKVSVVTGKVSFQPAENSRQELILLPGDAGVITKEGYSAKSKFGNQNFLYWKSRQLAFTNATLSEVLKTVENAYHVKFHLNEEELLNRRITTSFNQIPLSEVLEVIEVLLDLKIKKSGSVYVVEKKQ